MKQRLHFVSELFYPEMASTGYFMTELAVRLSSVAEVSAICAQPGYSLKGVKAQMEEDYQGVKIRRVWSFNFNRNRTLFRLLNALTFSIAGFIKMLRVFSKGDKILVVTTPPLMPFITALAALLRGASYYLLVYDTYPEALAAAGLIKRNGLLFRTADFFNRWLFKHSAKIIVIGRDMEQLFRQKAAGLDVKIKFIPNWCELDKIHPQSKDENPILKRLGISDKFIFAFGRNFGRLHDVETILKAVEHYKNDERFHFLFIGDGAKKGLISNAIQSLGLRNTSLLEPLPHSEKNAALNCFDVGIIALMEGMAGVSVPCRAYNLMAAGKPILGILEKESEIARMITENEIGWQTMPCDAKSLIDLIELIYSRRNEIPAMSSRARKLAETEFTLEKAVEKYIKALELRTTSSHLNHRPEEKCLSARLPS